MSADTARDVLQNRAAQLARPRVEGRTDAVLDLLLVTVGRAEPVALEARAVRDVLRDEPLCRLPGGGGALLAVAVVGGETVPVADLGAFFDGGEPRRDRPFLVVLEGDAGAMGFLVDEVREVETVHLEDLKTVSSASESPNAPHRLMTPDGAVVLDTEPLLSDDRLVIVPPIQTDRHPIPPSRTQGAR